MSELQGVCRLSSSLYPSAAVDRGLSAYSDLMHAVVDSVPGCTVLRITLKPTAEASTIDEFLNYVLCAAIEIHLEELE
jgi:hypothetical protein